MKLMATALSCVVVVAVLAGCLCEDWVVVTPGGEGKLAIRVNCGAGADYVDGEGITWLADRLLEDDGRWGAVGGLTIERTGLTVEGTNRPTLYLFERYSMDGYQFAVPPGTYTVRLHFAETYEGIEAAGERVFSVKINGQAALTDLDVLKETGGLAKPLVKTVAGLEVPDGTIKIEFVANVQNPEINAIEVLAH